MSTLKLAKFDYAGSASAPRRSIEDFESVFAINRPTGSIWWYIIYSKEVGGKWHHFTSNANCFHVNESTWSWVNPIIYESIEDFIAEHFVDLI